AGVLGWVTNPPRLPQKLRLKSATTSTASSYGLGQCRQLLLRSVRDGDEEPILSCYLGGGGGEEQQLHRRRRRARPPGAFREPDRGTPRGTIRDSLTVAFSTSACSPSTAPVEEEPGSSDVSPTPCRNAARGFPGPSVPAATAAVARGDVENGLDIFLQCMSRRRLKLAAEAASTRGQGDLITGRNLTGNNTSG
ncbi:unnamed protein product, partial [Laminaria digitata]